MRLIQYKDETGARAVGAREGNGKIARLDGVSTVYELAQRAMTSGASLAEEARGRMGAPSETIEALATSGRLLAPLDHANPRAHWLTGTGFTHMEKSAQAARRKDYPSKEEIAALPDAQRLIASALESGRPAPGEAGLQPEWFYKGDGGHLVGPGGALTSPAFAEDGSEEAEVVAHYLIDAQGAPRRIGFTLGNEFTDHAMDAENAYYLSHAKIRPCSVGPELLIGDLPAHIEGRTRILRGDEQIFDAPFWAGEDHMTHSLANLERHHFKYDLFRRPGDLHSHFLGTTTMSYPKGVRLRDGDLIELHSPTFGAPLRNAVRVAVDAHEVDIKPL